MPSCSAAAQNGSSSSESFGLPLGYADEDHAAEAEALRLAQLRHRHVDVDGRHLVQPDEALRIGGHELVVHPLVVRVDPGEVVVVVGLGHERAHRALRRVQHLGRHAVDVLVLEARLAVERAGADVVVRRAVPLELFVPLAPRPGAGDETERHRRRAGDQLPRIAALRVLHEAGHAVVELRPGGTSPTCGAARSCARRSR